MFGQQTVAWLDLEIKAFDPAEIFPKTMPINANISCFFLHLFVLDCQVSGRGLTGLGIVRSECNLKRNWNITRIMSGNKFKIGCNGLDRERTMNG